MNIVKCICKYSQNMYRLNFLQSYSFCFRIQYFLLPLNSFFFSVCGWRYTKLNKIYCFIFHTNNKINLENLCDIPVWQLEFYYFSRFCYFFLWRIKSSFSFRTRRRLYLLKCKLDVLVRSNAILDSINLSEHTFIKRIAL